MRRREFLTLLFGAVAADRLLWVPGERRIFIPPKVEMIAINLAETRAGNGFHNGLASPNDYLTYLPIWRLDPVCRKAFEDHIQFQQNYWRVQQWQRE